VPVNRILGLPVVYTTDLPQGEWFLIAKPNMTRHANLIEDAKEAIDNVFSDRSVSPATTLDSLEGLRDDLDMQIEALKLTLDDEDDLEANR